MRTLKFRAWDGKQMMYLDLYNRFWYSAENKCIRGAYPDDKKRLKTMQFTEVRINDVEIYEGDIIKQSGLNVEVIWNGKGSFVLDFKSVNPRYENLDFSDLCDLAFKVGNIHQNPELLKRDKV